MPPHTAILWICIGGWLLFELWVFARERGGERGTERDRGSRFVVLASLGLGLALAARAVRLLPAATVHAPVFAWGIALLCLGVALRLWAIRTLGKFFRTSVVIQPDHRIVTVGPYRLLRNPSYTGALLSMAGIGLALQNWASFALAPACLALGYAWRIRVEQQALLARFGTGYAEYMKHTWALVPFLW